MYKFHVIWWDFNKSAPESYDVLPYLMEKYFNTSRNKRPSLRNKTAIIKFISAQALRQWWGRCQYEIIICNWPSQNKSIKIDIYNQIQMNKEIIAELLIKNIRDQNKLNRS